MITFPGWYEGGHADLELVMLDLLRPYMAELTPTGVVCTQLPDNYEDLIGEGRALVRVHRNGLGAVELIDHGSIQLAVLTAKRADSWDVMEYLRQVLGSYYRGGAVHRLDGSVTELKAIEELVGPQLLPDLNPDDRMVVAPFRVSCRKPRGLPDYARIRESRPQ